MWISRHLTQLWTPVTICAKYDSRLRLEPFMILMVSSCNVGNKLDSIIIQIKICAEYQGMLPRPRLVCQEPTGRSPGVPDKTSRGRGSMSRYSAQILICFIAFVFILIPLWVWLGTLQDCYHAQYPLPLSIVIRMRLVIRQTKLPAGLGKVQLDHEHSLAFMPQDWWNWQIKWMKSVSLGSYQ